MPEFWKSWNAKFRKNVSKRVISNIFTSDIDIANEFAMHFKQVFVRPVDDDVAYNNYVRKRAGCIKDNSQSSHECINKITVELIDKCLGKLIRKLVEVN